MNDYKKYALIGLVAVAVIVAAVAAIVVSSKRAEVAAAMAEKTVSDGQVKISENRRKAAEAAAKTAEDNRKAEEAKEKVAENNRKAEEAKEKVAENNRKAEEAKEEAARLEKEKADLEAEKASNEKLAAEENRKAKELEETIAEENRKAEEASEKTAAENRKTKEAEATIAEAKKLELEKIDFVTWSSNLREWEQDLADRERALAPERTITDLLGGVPEDTVFDENGNVCKKPKVAYRAENDKTLPRSSRELAKAERELGEMASNETARVRAAIVTPLEKEYAQARKEDRVLDANYIADAIKLLYPDWEEPKGTEGTKETKQDLNNERQQ